MPIHYRACNLCEAICGLEIKYEGNQILSIEGDKADPFSRGHICPKAVALKDIYEDPNRLKLPIRKTENGWEQIGWTEAFDHIAARIKAIQTQHGHNAVAMYAGNPSVHNSGTYLAGTGLMRALNTQSIYTATSADQLPHHFAAWQMFGHPFLLPIPDIDHTQYWLIMGGNPMASNGSLMTAPDVAHRIEDIQKRGGKVVVIDPRFTETSAKASEHHFIKPGSDAYFLLAVLQVIFEENLDNSLSYTTGLEEVKNIVKDYTPESVATITGITADAIRDIARDFAGSSAAIAYGRMGLSVQAFGGVCQWLINVLNVVTGNTDRVGGVMFTQPAFDAIATAKAPYDKYNRYQSRVRGLPEFMGELPVACLTEEISTEGAGQIKALITSCGNPVLSTPNGRELAQALDSLEFMVSIDIYLNETTRHADIILPPATGLEVSHFDLTFNALAIRNTVKFSEPLFAKAPDAKYDWEIMQELTVRLSGTHSGDFVPQDPHQKIDLGLQYGAHKLSLDKLRQNPHGIDLGALKPCLPERILTVDKKINLAPTLITKDMARVANTLNQPSDNDLDLMLINRRHVRDNNSWMHNSKRLMKGRNRCTLLIHPQDAAQRNIADGQTVSIRSRVGEVQTVAEISPKIMPGVVSLPHGYGHTRTDTQLYVAQAHAGVSVNDLTDPMQLDELTGNAVFCGVPVTVN